MKIIKKIIATFVKKRIDIEHTQWPNAGTYVDTFDIKLFGFRIGLLETTSLYIMINNQILPKNDLQKTINKTQEHAKNNTTANTPGNLSGDAQGSDKQLKSLDGERKNLSKDEDRKTGRSSRPRARKAPGADKSAKNVRRKSGNTH